MAQRRHSIFENTIDIKTNDGAMETFVRHPEHHGPFPAVFLLMDAPGIREELCDMARRRASVGYFVLLPNLYYRAGRDTMYGPDVLEDGPERERMRVVRTKMTIPPIVEELNELFTPSGNSGELEIYQPSITASPFPLGNVMINRPRSGIGSDFSRCTNVG
jgi:hypothetical protein